MSIFGSKFVTIFNSFCLVILSQCKVSQSTKPTESDYPQANDGRGKAFYFIYFLCTHKINCVHIINFKA